jgi:hypothetical protein
VVVRKSLFFRSGCEASKNSRMHVREIGLQIPHSTVRTLLSEYRGEQPRAVIAAISTKAEDVVHVILGLSAHHREC